MNPFSTENPFAFLLDILTHLLVLVFMLRLLLQWVRADIGNPISQVILKISNPVLLPMRRFIPPIGRMDTASLIAMFLIQLIGLALLAMLNGYTPSPAPLIVITLITLARAVLQLYFITLLAQALLSWLNPNPYNPATGILHSLNAPLLNPVRRILPPMGGIDFSAMVVMIGILFLMRVIG